MEHLKKTPKESLATLSEDQVNWAADRITEMVGDDSEDFKSALASAVQNAQGHTPWIQPQGNST